MKFKLPPIRPGIRALLAALFVFGSALWIVMGIDFSFLWKIRSVQVELKSSADLQMMLYLNRGADLALEAPLDKFLPASAEFKKLTFILPPDIPMKAITFDPKKDPGLLEIRSVTFRSLVRATTLTAGELPDLLEKSEYTQTGSLINGTLQFSFAKTMFILAFLPDAQNTVSPPHVGWLRFFLVLFLLLATSGVFFSLSIGASQRFPNWKSCLVVLLTFLVTSILSYFFLSNILFQLFKPNGNVSIALQFEQDDICGFFIDSGQDFNIHEYDKIKVFRANEFQTITFPLPERIIPTNIRFDPGHKPGLKRIQSITFRSFFRTITWTAEDISRLFIPIMDIAEFRLENGVMVCRTSGPDPFFVGTPELRQQLLNVRRSDQSREHALVLFFSILIGLFPVFFFVTQNDFSGFFRNQKTYPLAVSAAFLFIIFLPLANSLFHFIRDIDSSELRALTTKPVFQSSGLLDYPKAYTAYYNDHFEFRNLLVRLDSLWRVTLLKTSPNPWALVGRKGWWFLRSENLAGWDHNGIKDYLGLSPFSPQEIERLDHAFNELNQWLQERHIEFYLVLCPIKANIYSEYLPWKLPRVLPHTRLDQFLAVVAKYPSIHPVDPRARLLAEKTRQSLFYHKDVHWNHLGGFFAYEELGKAIARQHPGFQPVAFSDVSTTPQKLKLIQGPYGLVGMLNLNGVFADIEVITKPIRKTPRAPQLGKVLALHDSMFYSIESWLSADCTQYVNVHHEFKPIWEYCDLIEKEKPDIVIYDVTENTLGIYLK